MRFVALFTILTSALLAQPLARFDQTLIIYGSPPGNRARNIVPQSKIFVNATTYSDSTGSVACPGSAQVVLKGTSSCTSSSDAVGSFGFWLQDGDYQYTLQLPSGQFVGPFKFTVTGDSPIRPPTIIDIRSFGAICNPLNPTVQNATVDAAVQSAIAAGWKNIFIPNYCTWTVPGGIVPGGTNGISYYGENWLLSRIQPVAVGNAALQTEPLVQMHNINQAHSLNAPAGSSPNFDCPNGDYYNLSNTIDPVFTSTCYSQQLIYLNGDTIPGYPGIGISGSNIRNPGIGDAYFAGTYVTNGVGFRGDLESGNGTEFLCDINGGAGGQCFAAQDNVANNTSAHYTSFTNSRTGGNLIQINQRGVAFTGNMLYADAADISGSCTGNWIALDNAGIAKFRVRCADGGMTIGGLDVGLSRISAGVLGLGNGTQGSTIGTLQLASTRTVGVVVSGLPTCNGPLEGDRRNVFDSTLSILAGIGLTVVGGGGFHVPVFCDGTSWKIY